MKRFKQLAFIALAAVVLTGCASNPTLPLSRPAADQQAQLIVYRESAFVAGGVTVTVGAGGKAFANLDNGDVTALLPAGTHEIHVQARSATPTRLSITLEPGATVCLRTSASPGTYGKALVPIALIATGYHFYLNPLPCPAKDVLAKYKDVVVAYQ